jgi:divalent metal cation (Fe/Co/Zn/Cd) transporter
VLSRWVIEPETAVKVVRTYVVVFSLLGLYLTFWGVMLFYSAVRAVETVAIHLQLALIAACVLLLAFLIMLWWTVYALYARKPHGHTLAVVTGLVVLFFDAAKQRFSPGFSFWARIFDMTTMTHVVYDPFELIYVLLVGIVFFGLVVFWHSTAIHELFERKVEEIDLKKEVLEQEEKEARMEYY